MYSVLHCDGDKWMLEGLPKHGLQSKRKELLKDTGWSSDAVFITSRQQ
jgi:hypothetical protein